MRLTCSLRSFYAAGRRVTHTIPNSMKLSSTLKTAVILVAFLASSFVAQPFAEGRTLTDIDVIPQRVLQRSVSRKFYKSLLVSPVQGWIAVRADLMGTHLASARVIHSELNGAYDSMALKLAKEAKLGGYYSIEGPRLGVSVLLHLLVYQIADGTMVLSFLHLEQPGGDQVQYYGCARLAVLKSDGKWIDIRGPENLEKRGWVVRQGVKNNFELALKMEIHRP